MPGPWDDYATSAAPQSEEKGPWSDFQAPNPLWARAGRAFNPAMRMAVGAASGGVTGAIQGWLTAAEQAAEPVKPVRAAGGALDALQAGYQTSATGLLLRGRLPDVVLDSTHKKWYESALAMAASTVSDLPEMIGGGLAAGAAGLPTGPGALALGGAAAFATPTAIRQALMTGYSLDQVQNSSEFLGRVGIGIKETGKSALVGALTGPAGAFGKGLAAPVAGKVFGETGARVATNLAGLGTEGAVLAVAPAALEGRLPEKEDFINTAILLGGFKAAHATSQGLQNIYARTGIRPEQVARDAQTDPTILEDLAKTTVPEPKASVEPQRISPDELNNILEAQHIAKGENDFRDTALPGMVKTFGSFTREEIPISDIAGAESKVAEGHTSRTEGPVVYDPVSHTILDGNHRVVDAMQRGEDVIEAYVGQPKNVAPTEGLPLKIEPEPEVPRAYKDAADQQAAADAVPGEPISDTTKAMAAELFGPPVKVPGEPEPTHVNYKYLNTPDQVNGALARMSELNLEEIQRQRRDIVPWTQTEHEAGVYLGRLLGSKDPIQARAPGTPAAAAELLARKQLVEGAASDMVAQAKAIAENPTTATREQLAELLVSVDRAAMIQSEFLGARAEAGRALNILKNTKDTADRAEQIHQVLVRFGKDPIKLAQELAMLDNPESAAKRARTLTQAGLEQKALEVWKSGLVSGPITQVANVMGNTTYMSVRPLVDATASIMGTVTRAEDRVHYTEPLARVIGNLQGTMDGLKLARTALSVEAQGGKAEVRAAIPGTTGYVIRTPFRALEALDVMFRTMNERGEAYAMGAREAASEGLNPATREFRERTADLANNPPEEWIDSIEAFGKRAVFRTPLGEKGKAITEAIIKNHLEWVVPFRGTPANIFKELTRMSPAAPIIGEWRTDFAKGGVAQAKAIAEMTVGSSIAALTMNWAFSGHISGAGDPDPAKRRVQMAAGWQPYSVKVGNTWYSYQRFQPVGTLVGMAADMAEVWQHMTPEESDKVPRMLAVAFSNAVTNQTFLQGITMLVDALSEPDRRGPRLIQNMVGSAIPAIVGQSAQLTDDYKREVTSIREAIMNRIPGLREALPVQRDPWGEPAPNPSRLGLVSPVIESSTSDDKVRLEAARLGVGAQKAPKAVTIPTRGLIQGSMGKVQLTPEQRDVFASVAGKTAYGIMNQIVSSPTWEATPDVIKAKIYQAALERANRVGSAAALSDSQRQQEVNRVMEEVNKRLKK